MKEHYLSFLDLPADASVDQVKEAICNRLNGWHASWRNHQAPHRDLSQMYVRIVQRVGADLISLQRFGDSSNRRDLISDEELLVLLLDASWQLYRAGEYECVIYTLADAIQLGYIESAHLSAEIHCCCALAMAALGDDQGSRIFIDDAIAASASIYSAGFKN